MLITEHETRLSEVARWSAVVLTASAAAIHFAVTPEHFDEYWAFGVFFAASAWAQIGWALLVTRSDRRKLLVAGVIGNLAIAVVWLTSRTTGLPIGPEPGAREAAQFIDVLATVLEALAAGLILVALRSGVRTMRARAAAVIIAAVAAIVIPMTTAAIASHTHESESAPHDTGRTHESPKPHG
jgi:MFS family permease